jgi:hypothetical protein
MREHVMATLVYNRVWWHHELTSLDSDAYQYVRRVNHASRGPRYVPLTRLPSLVSIHMYFHRNQSPPVAVVFPNYVEDLRLDFECERPLPLSSLPACVKRLQLNSNFDQPLNLFVFPKRLEELHLGDNFNQSLADRRVVPIVHLLPAGLKKLSFGNKFNNMVGLKKSFLPDSLEELTFGYYYNLPLLPGMLPILLRKLTFGKKYRFPFRIGSLPALLEELTFGEDFKYPIKSGWLPTSLQRLTFGPSYVSPLAATIRSVDWTGHVLHLTCRSVCITQQECDARKIRVHYLDVDE